MIRGCILDPKAVRDVLAGLDAQTFYGQIKFDETGKNIYYMLEDDFELWLLNARYLNNVPGRKTYVKDAEWICQLLEHGLVLPSFVPPKAIRELRNLTRYRKRQIQERAEEVQRLEKVSQDAGVKLSSVARRVLGASGRAMIEALLSGTTDPKVLGQLAKGRLRKKIPELEEVLEGNFSSSAGPKVGGARSQGGARASRSERIRGFGAHRRLIRTVFSH